jgi:hypothetical protein
MQPAISSSAAGCASGQQGFPAGTSGQKNQPVDFANVPRRETGTLIREVPVQMSSSGDPAGLLGNQSYPLAHPRILDELARFPLQRGQDGADRCPHARDDGSRV